MASEYLKWKYRDVQPDPPPRELTPKERRANWWHYHKWHVLIAAALVIALSDVGYHVLGVGQTEPDFQIACISTRALPDSTAAALESALSALAPDRNGDGKSVVQLNTFLDAPVNADSDTAMFAYASNIQFIADLNAGDSRIFLLEDPDSFQERFDALEGDGPYRWTDCPALMSLELGEYSENILGQQVSGRNQEILSGLSLARRDFPEPDDGWAAFWAVLTEGAVS